MKVTDYIPNIPATLASQQPIETVRELPSIISAQIATLSGDYVIADNIARHKSAIIEPGAILKGPCIIGPGCFIAAYAYLRGGVWLEGKNIIGPGVEIKTSFLGQGAKLAHFNFVGDSLIGHDVNMEAGSIIANYRNEDANPTEKFGALLGNGCRIGANAVLAPGTLLKANTIVNRLALIDQKS